MKRKIVSVLLTTGMIFSLTFSCQAAEAEAAGGATGPNGEAATPASEIQLTEEEKEQIREGGYTAAISMHYGGNDWGLTSSSPRIKPWSSRGVKSASCSFSGGAAVPSSIVRRELRISLTLQRRL